MRLPRISPWLLRWFTAYTRRYLRRHFHAVRLSRTGLPPQTGEMPLVLYMNHPSWWDPLLGLMAGDRFFPERQIYAPIDADMLQKYKFFSRLGFFGVERGSGRSARQFLRIAEAVISDPHRLLALTPQGCFADVRERPVRFQSGIGHLAARLPQAMFLPMAIEYTHWGDRLPEVLIRFGDPLITGQASTNQYSAPEWRACLEQRMETTQDTLAIESQSRDPEAFETLLAGAAGQGGIYDWWRKCRAAWRGESFNREHDAK